LSIIKGKSLGTHWFRGDKPDIIDYDTSDRALSFRGGELDKQQMG